MLPRVILLGLVLLAPGPLAAEEPGRARLDPRALAARTPPPGAWRAPEVPLEAYFSREELDAWRRYRSRARWTELGALALALLSCLLLLTRLGRRAHRGATALAERLARARPFRARPLRALGALLARAFGADWGGALLYALLYFGLGVILDLPIALLHEQAARAAGLSTYTAGLWALHFAQGVLVGLGLFALLVLGLYGLIRRFPRGFWLLLALPVGLAVVGHRLVEPFGARLYHELTPLERSGRPGARELAARLRALARVRGVELATLTVVASSRTSRALNAYLAGAGPTRELVLYDTLLAAASAAELEAVVAHELEHERRRSLLGESVRTALGLILFLALLAAVLRLASARLRFEGPGDIRTLPLVGLTALLVFNLALPIANHRSRQAELEADRAALVLTGDPRAFISLQVKLARANREEVRPSALVKLWFFDHPPVAERIAQARWYAEWLEARRP